jgi:hypothetical protein
MQMKLALSFMTGVLAMAAVVYFAGGRFAGPMFFAGAFAVICPLVCVLASVSRLRGIARFLNTFADSWDSFSLASSRSNTRPPVVAFDQERVSGYRKPSRKQAEQITRDSAAEYLDLDDTADALFGSSPSRRVS